MSKVSPYRQEQEVDTCELPMRLQGTGTHRGQRRRPGLPSTPTSCTPGRQRALRAPEQWEDLVKTTCIREAHLRGCDRPQLRTSCPDRCPGGLDAGRVQVYQDLELIHVGPS